MTARQDQFQLFGVHLTGEAVQRSLFPGPMAGDLALRLRQIRGVVPGGDRSGRGVQRSHAQYGEHPDERGNESRCKSRAVAR